MGIKYTPNDGSGGKKSYKFIETTTAAFGIVKQTRKLYFRREKVRESIGRRA